MVFDAKYVKQIKRKNNWHTYLKLVNPLVKPVVLYARECWGGSIKKELLNQTQNLKFKEIGNKIEQFHMSI